jgi:hypothetical protein
MMFVNFKQCARKRVGGSFVQKPEQSSETDVLKLWTQSRNGTVIERTRNDSYGRFLGQGMRECRKFRVKAITMQLMEASYGATKTTDYSRSAA